MFAVVKTGGKQYKVAVNDILEIERLPVEAGDVISFDDVLMVGDDKGVKIGTPRITDVAVTAEIIDQIRGDKIIVFKKQRRHHYRRRHGHRQDLSLIRITAIGDVKAEPKKAKTAKKAAPETAVAAAEE